MSNRDGKPQKRSPYRVGALCPRCKKDKMVGCDQANKEGHKHHAFCKTCKCSNF